MKRAKVRHKKATSSKFFQGELMTCDHCGRQQQSNPHVSSEWTVAEVDGVPLYFCPACFGNIPDYWQHNEPARKE